MPPPEEPSVIEGSVKSILPGSQRAGGFVITRIGGSGSVSVRGPGDTAIHPNRSAVKLV